MKKREREKGLSRSVNGTCNVYSKCKELVNNVKIVYSTNGLGSDAICSCGGTMKFLFAEPLFGDAGGADLCMSGAAGYILTLGSADLKIG